MAFSSNLSYFAPLIYGLPFSSNLFTQGSQKRGWSSKPDANYSSAEQGTAEATFGDLGSRGGNGGNASQMNIGRGSNPSASSYYDRQNTLQGLGKFAGQMGMSAGTVGAGLLAAGAPAGFAFNAAVSSAFNPASFAGALGQLGATVAGVDTRGVAQNVVGGLLGGLGGMVLGPVGGILGAAAAPFVGDALGDLTNSRSYERVRDIAEDLAGGYSAGRTLGTGFAKEMEANAKYSDVLGQGSLAMNAATNAAQRSGITSRASSNFDPVTGPQAMARAALAEQGVAGGWETQARINAAMSSPAVNAAKAAIDVARAAGLTPTTTVQAVGAPTARAAVNSISNNVSSISTAPPTSVQNSITQESFSQPSMSSPSSVDRESVTDNSGSKNIDRGGGSSSGEAYGGFGSWGGMFRAGIDIGTGMLGGRDIDSMLSVDRESSSKSSSKNSGSSGSRDSGDTGGSSGGKDTGNSDKGGSKGSSKN